ncbi:hypothetical protein CEXT_668341 [Caerostris extrusa]|uniref:Uncharacterized protein n=1 Tax=Caerostris extrusa TaxID=172846 RepID=A0AAV4UB53_CAEEX|nr:hypothetical protein CEXT_668341 [Caerostris extrusa]
MKEKFASPKVSKPLVLIYLSNLSRPLMKCSSSSQIICGTFSMSPTIPELSSFPAPRSTQSDKVINFSTQFPRKLVLFILPAKYDGRHLTGFVIPFLKKYYCVQTAIHASSNSMCLSTNPKLQNSKSDLMENLGFYTAMSRCEGSLISVFKKHA